MGLLDDAIRDHLQLKLAHGADEDEIRRLEQEALGPARASGDFAPATDEVPAVGNAEAEPWPPSAEAVAAPAAEPPPSTDESEAAPPPGDAESRLRRVEPEPWLDDPDEVPPEEALDHPAAPGDEDVLEETPEFLQETPEHDRLWFEQKPPRGFDFDK